MRLMQAAENRHTVIDVATPFPGARLRRHRL
jgi:hypothetical protein